uniref:Uncharacterized protein n=1 Tax=Zea mays TaxID=4577 RepID=C4J6I4_MAIZE|nr:unknown [Zea mays]
MPPPRLRARLSRHQPRRHRVRAVAQRAGHVRDAVRSAHERRRAQQHQHAPGRAHGRRPAPPLRLQARLRGPGVSNAYQRRAEAAPAGAPGTARHPRRGSPREGAPCRPARVTDVRGASREGRPGVRVGSAGQRVGPDGTQLHLRHDVGAQGGGALPPRDLLDHARLAH